MIFKGYEVLQKGSAVKVRGIKDFSLEQTFECGQCFRWVRGDDGRYTGVAGSKVIEVALDGDVLTIENCNISDFIETWYNYFDLGTDYGAIKQQLANDEIMARAIAYGSGIRILRQEFFETLISFITSANNRIPMIRKVVASISKSYGKELLYKDDNFYTFPSPEVLACCSLDALKECKGGFRCRYIIDASAMVGSGHIDGSELAVISADEARRRLSRLPGVGDKVADCTLLYSGTRQDVFPTDVWVKRVMEELYFKREASFKEIRDFASSHFGSLAGYAQQYLFFYARENKIGAK